MQKTDQQGNRLVYGRDGQGRVNVIYRYAAGQTVPASTVSVGFDTAENGWGRVAWITHENGQETYKYTPAGQVKEKSVQYSGVGTALTAKYEWSPWGLTSIQYPDVWQWNGSALVVAQAGRTLTMNYDDVHRPTKMIDMAIPYPYQVATATWTAAGQLATFTAPDGTETFQYNVLGQMTDQSGRGVHIGYEYSATQNDGRIQRKRDYTGGEVVEYSYDDLGRLGTARTTDTAAWGLSFSYDRWGNRTNQSVTAGTGPTSNLTYNGMTNRIADAGFAYDLNGNMTQWPAGVTATAAYDLENRVTQVTSFGGTEYYGYGVGAQRVWKQRPNGQRDYFFYGLSGEVLGVYQTQTAGGQTFFATAGPRVYFAGRQVLPKAVTDRLGSVVSTDTASFKYFPYGEQQGGASQEEQQKYATYWRDGATGLDYAVNRYFSSQMGRFLSADPYQASGGAAEPGSWNRYAYTQGDPINTNDSAGLLAAPLEPPPIAGGRQLFLAFLERAIFTVQMRGQAVSALSTMSVNCRTVFSSTILPVSPPGAVGPTWSVLDAITSAASSVYFYD